MPVFTSLELENFKSYAGRTRMEWMQITGVIGPNGSGKSSIVDAIEFVCCFRRYSRISVENLRCDICNSELYDADDVSETWVELTLDVNGQETIFRRVADYHKSAHRYFINHEEVTAKVYKASLLEHNLNYRANNFLVQQNGIESIAMASTKDRCEMIERLSGSIAYKADYISLSDKLNQISGKADELKKELVFYAKQEKNSKKTSTELKRCEKLKNELRRSEYNYYFAKIHQIDRSIENLNEKQEKLRKYIKVAQRMKISTENEIASLKTLLAEQESALESIERESENAKQEMLKCSANKSEINQKLSCCEKKIEKVKANLEREYEKYVAHKKIIKDLQHQKQEVEQQREILKSQSQTSSLNLDDEQYDTYLQLKSEALQKCAKEISLIDSVTREQESVKDKIDDYQRKVTLLSEQIKKEKLLIDKIKSELSNIDTKINETVADQEVTETKINKLDEEIASLTGDLRNLEADIEDLDKKIDENKESRADDLRARRKCEILDKLKSNCSGVHDRLINLCSVDGDHHYKVAITKLMKSNLDNIVVDDVNSAKKCIQILKELYRGDKFSAIETFLPLDNLKIKEFDKRIIEHERNTVFAIDVMDVASNKYRIVLESILGSAVICDTDQQAMELSKKTKLKCVSLNGTLYKKDGTFSGGLADLLQQSKKWNDKEIQKLKDEKQNKVACLREKQKEINKKLTEKIGLESKLEGLKKRLVQYLRPLSEGKKNELSIKENNLSDLEKKLEDHKSSDEFEELCNILKRKTAELKEIELKKHDVENKVFANFCATFHLENIQQYEQGDFNKHKERTDKKEELDVLIDKIDNEIEFEKSRNPKATVKKLQANLDNLEKEFEGLKREQEKLKELHDKNTFYLKKDNELKSARQHIEKIQQDIKRKNIELKGIERDLKQWNASIVNKNAMIASLENTKHELLVECKMNNINIPLCSGSIENVKLKNRLAIVTTESSESSSQSSGDTQISETDIEIDYSKLSQSIKNLGDEGLNNHINILKDKVTSMREELGKDFPDAKAIEQIIAIVNEKLPVLKTAYNKILEELSEVKANFDDVKKKRYSAFMQFIESITEKLNIIKKLYNDPSAQAHIILNNPDEPYLGGIGFSCVIPKKKFIPMENLSGGEKTMCSMALLLAIYSVKPAPFLIFDEIDAALDNANIRRVKNLFLDLKSTTQIIIISHRELLSTCADATIGINYSPRKDSSYAIHVELTLYLKETVAATSLKYTSEEKPAVLRSKISKKTKKSKKTFSM